MYGLRFSFITEKSVKTSRSMSFGLPSGRAIPARVISIGPHETRVGVGDLVAVRVVHPHHRAAVSRPRTGPLRNPPDVGVRAALRNGVVGLVRPTRPVVV